MIRPSRLLTLAAACLAFSACVQRGPDAVILVSIDTLRADHVGLYGKAPVPTPGFDRIGLDGAVFESAVAPFSRTTQSVGTMLTGLHPLRHGADGLGMRLPERVETLAETFGAAGYDTAAFTSNYFLRPALGYEQGFELYSNPTIRWHGNSARSITREALAWLDHRRGADRPFFLWLHYLDPHWPYEPPADAAARSGATWDGPFPLFERVVAGEITKGSVVFHADEVLTEREIEHVRRLYAAEVSATDDAVGELVRGLEELGLWDRVWVVLTSDHGESTGDHRYWFAHGEYIYDDVLKVPLAVRAPGVIQAGTRIGGTVRLEDVAPTLLDLAGLEPPPDADGISHADLLRGGGSVAPERLAVHLADHHLVHPENPRRTVPGREGRWWAVRRGGWKLLRVPLEAGGTEEELYRYPDDPSESNDLLAAEPERAQHLRDALDAWRRALPARATDPRDESDEQNVEMLRSLGYVN